MAAVLVITGLAGFDAYNVYAAEGYDQVASSSEMSSALTVGKYGMVPIYGMDIKDGEYNVTMESSSSFFHIVDCKLTVKKGKMKAVFLIASYSYKCVYLGTGEEAAKAPLEDYVFAEDTDLGTTFEIPVEALNKEIPLAAFSKKKKKWYDRLVIVDASSIPATKIDFLVPDYNRIESAVELYDQENGTNTREELEKHAAEAKKKEKNGEESDGASEPADINMKDGTYSIEVNMTGGSGRASVSSPTWLIVKDGKAYARLLWSSSYYDFMLVGGKKYLNESTNGGNSTFTIPITQFDTIMNVVGDTTSMGDPVAIGYKLTFYKDSISTSNKIPQEAAKGVIAIAAAVALIGGILNYIIKRKQEKKVYRKRRS
jgi:uncharacterized protein with FMN-binding domain